MRIMGYVAASTTLQASMPLQLWRAKTAWQLLQCVRVNCGGSCPTSARAAVLDALELYCSCAVRRSSPAGPALLWQKQVLETPVWSPGAL